MPRQHVENTKEFWSENEAKRANKHANKRIIYRPPFWNKVYSSVGESTASASQRTWVRVRRRHHKFFRCAYDNRWDCPVSVRIISSNHLSTTLHKHLFQGYLTYICLRQYETISLTSPISTQADLSSCVMDSSTSPERNLFTDSFSVSSSS